MTLWSARNQTNKSWYKCCLHFCLLLVHWDTHTYTHSGTIREHYKYCQWKGYYNIFIHMLIRHKRDVYNAENNGGQMGETLSLYHSADLQLSVSPPSLCNILPVCLSVSLPAPFPVSFYTFHTFCYLHMCTLCLDGQHHCSALLSKIHRISAI